MGGMKQRREPTHVVEHRFITKREVWWCTLGINVGSEENSSCEEYRRPALILKGLSIETCLIVPLTTSAKDHPLRVAVGQIGGKQARAILSQMRVIDTKRLVRKIEYLDVDTSRYEKPPKVCSDGYSAFCPLRGEPEGTCTSKYSKRPT
jgi:mRNA-degrading endonuclease toxin of MazEF toxin-antitoxin module